MQKRSTLKPSANISERDPSLETDGMETVRRITTNKTPQKNPAPNPRSDKQRHQTPFAVEKDEV